MATIHPSTFHFLRELRQNNTREWFHAHRSEYDVVKSGMEVLIGELIQKIGQFENLAGLQVKNCSYRIARDVRFTPDKSPYKTWLSASFSEGGRKANRMDYYLHVEPGVDTSDGETFLGGGMYAPTAQQLAKYRQEVDYNAAELKAIIEAPDFVACFGQAKGTQLKTTPKGYAKDHPELPLLRRTQLFYMHRFSDNEALSADFADQIASHGRILKPFLDFLNNVLFEETELKGR
ncbi:MAG: DUF2461 domain-containing protein [Cytophagaceae bacterium]|nr:DUF2461 domain-containing protein [Cytophagaceae bacterium]